MIRVKAINIWAVIETAVDVAATGMKLKASATGTAIKVTGAAADALIPDTKKTDPDPRISTNPQLTKPPEPLLSVLSVRPRSLLR